MPELSNPKSAGDADMCLAAISIIADVSRRNIACSMAYSMAHEKLSKGPSSLGPTPRTNYYLYVNAEKKIDHFKAAWHDMACWLNATLRCNGFSKKKGQKAWDERREPLAHIRLACRLSLAQLTNNV